MNNNKQTAVEWLIEKIEMQRENGNTDLRTTLHYCDKAKAMEKEQIIEAYCMGDDNIGVEQYYNETYGGNK